MLHPVYVRGYEIKSNNIPLVFLFALVTDYYFQKEFFSSLQINSNSLKSTYLHTEPSGNSRVTIHKMCNPNLATKMQWLLFSSCIE